MSFLHFHMYFPDFFLKVLNQTAVSGILDLLSKSFTLLFSSFFMTSLFVPIQSIRLS